MTSRNRPFVSFLLSFGGGLLLVFSALMALLRPAAASAGVILCCQFPDSGCTSSTLTCPIGSTPVPGAICVSGSSCVSACGNGNCDIPLGENASNCPVDCGPPSPVCGNGIVEAGEECDPPKSSCLSEGDPGICFPDCTCFLPVTIDIKPDGDPNPINLKSKGVLPVAILTTDTFDATTVDPATVCFGAAEDPGQRDCTEAHGTGHKRDVNGDGKQDLVLHFHTQETGISLGDTQACLAGQTTAETPIGGCDEITTRTSERMDCGAQVIYRSSGISSVGVVLKDNCDQFDSEIECLRNADDLDSVYSEGVVPDGKEGFHVCGDIPLGGGVLILCNGLKGGCRYEYEVTHGPGPGE